MLHRPTSVLLVLAFAASSQARAQCTTSWSTNLFGAGADGVVTVVWSDDWLAPTVVGRFTTFGSAAANRIAQWDGSSWQALGTGLNGDALAIKRLANGDFVVGGTFTQAGGVTVNSVARWNGSSWSALGNGIDQQAIFGASVQAIAVLQNGDLIAAGGFSGASGVAAANIARWNGSSWSAVGGGCNGPVRGLAVAPNGDLYATGSFSSAGGVACAGIARWNGTNWSALGAGLGLFGGQAVVAGPNGEVFVGGSFVTAGGLAANRVARWSGGAWSALGAGISGPVTALALHPNGGLVCAGTFATAGGVTANNVALWSGSTWQAFDAGVGGGAAAVAILPDGSVAVGGDFTSASGTAANRIVRRVSSCAPTLTATGAGCAGQGGVPSLFVTNSPVLGATFRSRCTNLPPISIVLGVLGLAPTALPLAIALPQAGAGCTLYANPDVVDAIVPVAGAASYALAIPNLPALVGTSLHHQYVPLAFDLSFSLVGASASNAVQANVGNF